MDIGVQLAMNGGNFRCIDPWQVAISAGLGALGGGFGGRALSSSLKGLPARTKGNIGEGLSLVENRLKGSRLMGKQQPIPKYRTRADSTWQSRSGDTYYVESKFGNSRLRPAQRQAASGLRDNYRVERWTYPFFERAGSYPGGAIGGIGGAKGQSRDCCR